MKAAVYTKTESGKIVQIMDVEKPDPKENEVLLRVCAASVNPLDWRMKKRRPGVDVAGVVATAGKSVTRFKPGDEVFGACKGAFAEYACAKESALVIKPERLTMEQAASVPVAGLTALQGLRDKGKLKPGQNVLINGAAGGVGTFAVQVAKALGGEVTGVCSGRNVDLVRSLGADAVIDYEKEDFTQGGHKYDLLLDNVGNRPLLAMRRVMSSGGRCIMIGVAKKMFEVLGRFVKLVAWPPFLRPKFKILIAKVKKGDLELLCELMKTGKLTPQIDRCFPLSGAGDALAYVEQGHARAKVILSNSTGV
ncbi:MAG TPA: NAD(P)-dependent alcohol dehydrogenase [Candidatus Acidoferrum sp.]|nr:NAD(P)-dependent alcohol dehydrogenase [Candidatus Acidoferrum sp.]